MADLSDFKRGKIIGALIAGAPVTKTAELRVAQRLECSPMARETWVQFQVESYQRL